MTTFSAYVVSVRPVGWNTGAVASRQKIFVARSPEEAEGMAIEEWDLDPAKIAPYSVAKTVNGAGKDGHAGRFGLHEHVYFYTWPLDFDGEGIPMIHGGLRQLIGAYERVKELNAAFS